MEYVETRQTASAEADETLDYCFLPSSTGVHLTPATSTLPTMSEKARPRLVPWMVTRVPPSGGPATGVTCRAHGQR
ncbi:hypothetical protein EYF80_052295 [Liparis tanakae]|uniref:Uncharacterized protein n=1 Tax=Liparis tanakae TaxID=230148 RepID=A0A4Z2F8J1_9TELE|nr:hypothetical protein EYF80_052295 [Liparis tanakae]